MNKQTDINNSDFSNFTSSEDREFQVDQNLIYDLVFKQHTSVRGSLGELVMNCRDAGATRVDITLTTVGFSIIDNGEGFKSRDDVTTYFEVFGKPRDMVDDSKFGRFRMGRGQIFGHAKTQWTSNLFQMDVDFHSGGCGYILHDLVKPKPGCTVTGTWYRTMAEMKPGTSAMDASADEDQQQLNILVDELANSFQYLVGMDIYINDTHINDAQNIEWDYEDDLIRCKLDYDNPKTYYRRVSVYNLGSYITDIISSRASGIVVSKQHMNLNMTRSDVQDSCPVLKHIKLVLRQRAPQFDITRNYNIERSCKIIQSLLYGEVAYNQIRSLKLFPDLHKKVHFQIDQLVQFPFVIGNQNDYLADHLYIQKKIAVLHSVVWDDFSVEYNGRYKGILQGLQEWAQDQASPKNPYFIELAYWLKQNHKSITELAEDLDMTKVVIKSEDLKPIELAKLKACKKVADRIGHYIANAYPGNYKKLRSVHAGISTSANGWTDCKSYIAINRNILAELDDGFDGAFQLIGLLVHEYCHDDDDSLHDFEFYEKYHNVMMRTCQGFDWAKLLLSSYDDQLAAKKIKPSAGIIKALKSIRRSGKSKALQTNTK